MKRAFTMIELVFVIVILGILASIAVPRLFATRDEAVIARARADIASIRSAIVNMHNTKMLSGRFTYPVSLESGGGSGVLFDNVLQNGVKVDEKSGWSRDGGNYKFTLRRESTVFTYNATNGSFTCPRNDSLCRALTE